MKNKEELFLVTGGAGFIGSHVCERLLRDGYKVVALDNLNLYYSPKRKIRNIQGLISNENFTFIRGDIRNKELLDVIFRKYKFDYIIHLAARAGVRPSLEKPIWYRESNIDGLINLLELARQYEVKNFVFASSSSVYGDRETGPFKEDFNVDFPISPYAATKKAGELLAYTYHHITGIPMTCLRFFTVYGPGNRPDMVMSLFLDGIENGKYIVQFGDGTTKRSYTYIDDLVDGIVKSALIPRPYSILNLGGNETIQLKELISELEDKTGKSAKIKILPLQTGDVSFTQADVSKAKEELGWEPRVGFSSGIKKLVDWYRENSRVENYPVKLNGITKKVLVFSLNYNPFIREAEQFVEEVSKKIDYFHFDIITAKFRKDLKRFESNNHIRIFRVGFGNVFDKFLYPLFAVSKAISLRKKYDIVWGIMPSYGGFSAYLYSLFNKKIKYVLSIFRGESKKYIKKRTWFWYPIYKGLHASADAIQVSSKFQIQRVRKLGFRGEIKTVPNGISRLSIVEDVRNAEEISGKIGFHDSDIVLLTVAGPVEDNGVENVIRALEYLPEDIKLLVLKIGKKNFAFEKIYKKFNSRVRIVRCDNPDDILKYIYSVDSYIRALPSAGSPYLLHEAMIAKVPVIGTDVPGIREVVVPKNNGYLVKPNNPKDLAEQVKIMVDNDELRKELVTRAYAHASREYTWEASAEAMKELFESL